MVEKIGTVWTATAKLYDRDGVKIGTCIDTPNAIAKALMENLEIEMIKSQFHGYEFRCHYADRMTKFNEAKSGFMEA
jgi:disulfide oxidoreductase YuzD